jgi:hypothetical protein
MRKYWVSIVSMPEAGTPGLGRVVPSEEEGRRGVNDFVMACTLYLSDLNPIFLDQDAPVKCAGEDEVVVCVDILQTRVKVSLVHQTPGLVNDYQGEDDPMKPCCQYLEALLLLLKSRAIHRNNRGLDARCNVQGLRIMQETISRLL